MDPIKSVHNPLVKYLFKLKKRKYREQEGKFLIEGVRFVEEALDSGWPVESIIYSPDLIGSARGSRLVAGAGSRNIKIVPAEKKVVDALAFTEATQGVLALCRMKDRRPEEIAGARGAGKAEQDALLVVVDGVSDPGNLGTIIRSAHALGADGAVLLKGTVDLYNDKALRSTMGSVFHLPVAHNVRADQLRPLLSAGGISLLVGVPRGGIPVDCLNAKRPLALVVGSESEGPSGEIFSLPHERITVPMPGQAESLNVAVALSIMLYEIVRLRFGDRQ